MGGGFRFIAHTQEIFSIVLLAMLDAHGNQTTAPTAEQEWTVNDMRLGDLDALREELQSMRVTLGGKDIYPGATKLSVLQRIDEQPTIDAVPVVRCVNCIHYGAEASAFDAWTPFCLKHKMTTFPDDYCSYGEKKDGEG